jgi:hypothetical protein
MGRYLAWFVGARFLLPPTAENPQERLCARTGVEMDGASARAGIAIPTCASAHVPPQEPHLLSRFWLGFLSDSFGFFRLLHITCGHCCIRFLFD